MKAQDPVIGMIGLLQFTDPPLPEPAGDRDRPRLCVTRHLW